MKKCPSEYEEQKTFVNWFKFNFQDLIIFSIPNDGKRSNGGRMVATGLMSGISDLCILLPSGKTVFIEMKKQESGKLSPQQLEFIDKSQSLGHTVIVAHGCNDASKQFINYLNNI